MRYIHRTRNRSGTVLILTVIMMVMLTGFLALAVDIGYLMVADSELQRAADSAALSATWELVDDGLATGQTDPALVISRARSTAGEYTGYNLVTGESPALATQDAVIGCLQNPFDPNAQMTFADPTRYNAVTVHVRRTQDQNGEVPLFFARFLGFDRQAMEAEATAAYLNNLGGFQAPSNGENLEMLPFALDWDTWDALLKNQISDDDWTWNNETGQIEAGPDSCFEVNLFPQGTGSPGNRGTVDIGSNNNSTADIARQILHGISPQDLEYHGGKLEFDENGEMFLNGDTGISAGVKDELEAIKGQPRFIPIFSNVTGPGNNAQYTICACAAIRIMEVKLTGNMRNKRVIIQPTKLCTQGGIPGGTAPTSYFVYSPVFLVR